MQNLITDRKKSDVDRWRQLHDKGWEGMSAEEKAEWLGGMKGSYNASDLNRVGYAMSCLAAAYRSYGYSLAVASRTDWSRTELPKRADMEVYLSDLRTLRDALPMLTGTPETPGSMNKLTYEEANDIERILQAVEATLNRMAASWFYAGEIYSGEV